mmetsp:Transcript_45531/g.128197  ORF Transcript_45531/g.128197 Transcript_45531/m.128197 type:complete len:201 (-) Transcript_45531:196-798(-)
MMAYQCAPDRKRKSKKDQLARKSMSPWPILEGYTRIAQTAAMTKPIGKMDTTAAMTSMEVCSPPDQQITVGNSPTVDTPFGCGSEQWRGANIVVTIEMKNTITRSPTLLMRAGMCLRNRRRLKNVTLKKCTKSMPARSVNTTITCETYRESGELDIQQSMERTSTLKLRTCRATRNDASGSGQDMDIKLKAPNVWTTVTS